ncbi:MAG: ornithine carbamoyltransferase [Termitinemataceae bacterium]|nr:MAG: ornithine carbamoyltransferase [Termitinemataceae bacterium]
MNINLKGRSLLTWLDYSQQEILFLLDLSCKLKNEKNNNESHSRFKGKCVALIFEKRSTRTRCAFETALGEEGGHPVFLSTDDIQLGVKESVEDTARVLGRMFSAIEFRGFKQSTVKTLAEYSGVPVYNGLTDEFHPTQALADIMTLKETFIEIRGRTICYVGDGRNNVATSLIVICSKLGVNISIIAPAALHPEALIIDKCTPIAKESGATIKVSSDISDVAGAHAVYTDVWASMGEESLKAERVKLLKPYQVNSALMQKTGLKETIFMHCLPAIRGEEVTADVIDGAQSKVFEESENRKHTIKAIMLATL